jgi:hypothetical protein
MWRRVVLVGTDVPGERKASIIKVERISELGTLAVTSNWAIKLLVTANIVSSLLALSTLMMEASVWPSSSVKTLVLRKLLFSILWLRDILAHVWDSRGASIDKTTRRYIAEDGNMLFLRNFIRHGIFILPHSLSRSIFGLQYSSTSSFVTAKFITWTSIEQAVRLLVRKVELSARSRSFSTKINVSGPITTVTLYHMGYRECEDMYHYFIC